MNREHFFDTFDFDDQAVFDDVINAIGRTELDSLVNDRKMDLVLKLQVGLGEFVIEAGVAGTSKMPAPSAL